MTRLITPIDPHFEAMKAITRQSWLVNFEAIASAGNDEDALVWQGRVVRAFG